MKKIIGVDIGGTNISILLGNKQGEILQKNTLDTPATYSIAINNIETSIADIISQEPNVKAMGISCGGPLNPKRGIIQSPPNLPTWDNVPIVRRLKEKFKIPVFLENDANASCIAEWKWGAGKGYNNIIFLTFGTGIGAGLLLDGTIYQGSNFLAGEIGHIRMSDDGIEAYGKKGSAESFCSGTGIARLATHYGLPKNISAQEVFALAKKGNEIAEKVITISATQLGKLLAMLIDLLNPDCIIIGSIYARQEQYFYPIIKKIIDKEVLSQSATHCKILASGLKENLGCLSSLGVAIVNMK